MYVHTQKLKCIWYGLEILSSLYEAFFQIVHCFLVVVNGVAILGFCRSHCTCVCVFSSHSLWTSSSLDVPAGVTQEEGHTGFFIHLLSAVRALIFLTRRIQPFLSLVDCEVESCVLTI